MILPIYKEYYFTLNIRWQIMAHYTDLYIALTKSKYCSWKWNWMSWLERTSNSALHCEQRDWYAGESSCFMCSSNSPFSKLILAWSETNVVLLRLPVATKQIHECIYQTFLGQVLVGIESGTHEINSSLYLSPQVHQ